MGAIRPVFINVGFQCYECYRGTQASYTTSYISIPNDGDDLTCSTKQGFRLAINKLGIDPKSNPPEYKPQGFRSTLTQ